jgi:hypothetical protein
MKAMKTISFLIILVIVTVLAPDTAVALVYLPDSTYAELQNNWEGQREYKEDVGDGLLYILVEYSVYDTENLLKPGEIELADALGLSGRYIYAYQIWNHPSESTEEVLSFELLYAETKLNIPASAFEPYNDTSSSDDENGGVAPTPEISNNQGEWTFVPGDLAPGTHSWFLVFSSDFAPVRGTFEVTRNDSDFPAPDENVPEPASIALLGVASTWLLTSRRKKRNTA